MENKHFLKSTPTRKVECRALTLAQISFNNNEFVCERYELVQFQEKWKISVENPCRKNHTAFLAYFIWTPGRYIFQVLPTHSDSAADCFPRLAIFHKKYAQENQERTLPLTKCISPCCVVFFFGSWCYFSCVNGLREFVERPVLPGAFLAFSVNFHILDQPGWWRCPVLWQRHCCE